MTFLNSTFEYFPFCFCVKEFYRYWNVMISFLDRPNVFRTLKIIISIWLVIQHKWFLHVILEYINSVKIVIDKSAYQWAYLQNHPFKTITFFKTFSSFFHFSRNLSQLPVVGTLDSLLWNSFGFVGFYQ